jgi:hypothetical protein
MRDDFDQPDVHDLLWEDKSLYWYKQCSFIDQITEKRYIFYVKKIVRSRKLTRIDDIFTHCFLYEKTKRIFFRIRILFKRSHKDEVLNLSLYELTNTNRMISFSSIKAEKLYIILIDKIVNKSAYSNLFVKKCQSDYLSNAVLTTNHSKAKGLSFITECV